MKLKHELARRLGYELISLRKISDIRLEPEQHLQLLLRQKKIDVVVDVGANKGQYAASVREQGFAGRIVSFEPAGEAFDALQRAAAGDDRWDTHRVALGAKRDQLELNVYGNDTFSSFKEFNTLSESRFSAEARRLQRKERVEVHRLDEYLVSEGIVTPNDRIHLKLDTQGFDLEVFDGADAILDQVQSMQSEVSVSRIYENSSDYLESLSVFRAKGFELTGFYPIAGNRDSMVLIEADAYLSRP